jgi:glycine oxidase
VKSWDVIISGAGIIGVSIALELRSRGAQVLVLDSREPGAEASSAAAGMLAAADPETPSALRQLAMASAEMFPDYVRQIEADSHLQTDFRRLGTIAIMESSSAPREYKRLTPSELQKLEPSLQTQGHPVFFVHEDSVDPLLLMQAALAAARHQSIEIHGEASVQKIRSRGKEIEVMSQVGIFTSRSFVNCQGAWSGAPVKPRKGQMLYVQPISAILQHVLRTPEAYIVPRSNGKILIGATVEDVGFDKSVSPTTIQSLLNRAAKYLPDLAAAPIVQSWAGLRPGTPDDLPIIGPTEIPGAFIASGHFRNGILLAPVTARIMADLIQDRATQLDIGPFSPARFASKP